MNGYRELRESAAWLDLNGRGKIKAAGDDRARLLHAMTTNHVQQLQPGQGCYAFFLSAQGRVLADANLLCRPDHFLIDTEPEIKDALYAHLDHFIIADDVTLEDLTPVLVTIAVEGPQVEAVLTACGAPVPAERYAQAEWGSRLVARLDYTGGPGFFVIAQSAERADVVSVLTSAGAAEADAEAFETVRLEHGKPRYGMDISERYLSQETGQMQALHFNKGCYLGQEIVERVRSRAQIHRRLQPLTLDTDQPPAAGTKLMAGDKPAAEITSAAYSPALGKVVALGYIRVEYDRPGTELRDGDIPAVVGAPWQP